jgi:hypothetical protein
MLGALFNPAGGLRYHWRAVRHSRRWASFTVPLAQWLDAWQPESDQLLLVGPSAGWCLSDELFARFRRIDVLEPDPFAWLILSRRLHALGLRARWHEVDYLTADPVRVEQLAPNFPDSAILFCNVLGQVKFLHPELEDAQRASAWKDALVQSLDGREWATFHDRLSGSIAPRIMDHAAVSAAGLTDLQLAATFYEGGGQLISHGTEGLFPELTRRYFGWQIAPEQYHLIEAVRAD